jgi:TRAP-type mannitol/chloroaromatic compound transport system substrate-binding protein
MYGKGRDSDAIIREACQEAVQEMYDSSDENHEREIQRLQDYVKHAYEAELQYQLERDAELEPTSHE